jgi:hypothetical protein
MPIGTLRDWERRASAGHSLAGTAPNSDALPARSPRPLLNLSKYGDNHSVWPRSMSADLQRRSPIDDSAVKDRRYKSRRTL